MCIIFSVSSIVISLIAMLIGIVVNRRLKNEIDRLKKSMISKDDFRVAAGGIKRNGGCFE